MNKESATRLMNSPDGKVLVDYLAKKVLELDNCRTGLTNPVEVAIEMKAREKSIGVLASILDGLLIGKEQEFELFDKKEYAIDV